MGDHASQDKVVPAHHGDAFGEGLCDRSIFVGEGRDIDGQFALQAPHAFVSEQRRSVHIAHNRIEPPQLQFTRGKAPIDSTVHAQGEGVA